MTGTSGPGDVPMRRHHRVLGALAAFGLLAVTQAPGAVERSPLPDEKPFAEVHVVLQLSDGDAQHQAHVLNVAGNLIAHYGSPDLIDIEIVAFGPGIALLYEGNDNAARISSLAESGVRFIGCMNTVETIARQTGKHPKLNPLTIPVQAGVAHLIDRSGQGYTLIRP
jgi:intracellular sulfur oxidation DsrE/DsrF family protein